MTVRLSDLTFDQIRQKVRFDDGVSVSEESMMIGEFWLTGQLLWLGLVDRTDGHSGRVWYWLSEAGRRVREEGGA